MSQPDQTPDRPEAVPEAVEAAALEVVMRGNGPSVVFTHGWTDEAASWDGVIDDLSDAFHCTSWSLRAHGGSEITAPGTYTRAHALADLASVVGRVEVPTVLVGHSLGGYLSLAYSIAHPDQIRGLVLVGAGPGFSKPEAMEKWNESLDRSAEKKPVPEGSEVISKHYDSWVLDHMSEISVPTLVVLGEGDKAFAASAAVFEKRLDVTDTVIVPEAGHSVHRHEPQAVAAAIRSYLTAL